MKKICVYPAPRGCERQSCFRDAGARPAPVTQLLAPGADCSGSGAPLSKGIIDPPWTPDAPRIHELVEIYALADLAYLRAFPKTHVLSFFEPSSKRNGSTNTGKPNDPGRDYPLNDPARWLAPGRR